MTNETMVTPPQGDSELLLAKLDELAGASAQNPLEFGQVALKYFEKEKAGLKSRYGEIKDEKDFMTDEEARLDCVRMIISLENVSKMPAAKKTVQSRMRVAEIFTPAVIANIEKKSDGKTPSFHQVRECIVTKPGAKPTERGSLDQDATGAMIDFCVANKWPPVIDITKHRAEKFGLAKKSMTPEEKFWKSVVKGCQNLINVTSATNPHNKAACCVLDVWAKETGLKPEM